MSAAAGHTDLLEEDALDALLEGATETSTAGQWQGALPLQALAALAAPASRLRGRIMSSIQQMLPAMLAASISNQHNQQMLIGVLEAVRHKLAPFAQSEEDVAAAISLDLLTGMRRLTMVCHTTSYAVDIELDKRMQTFLLNQSGRLWHFCIGRSCMTVLGLPATEEFRKIKEGLACVSAGLSCHIYVLIYQVMRHTSVLRVKRLFDVVHTP